MLKSKKAIVLIALMFAIPFGLFGLFSASNLAKNIWDWSRARYWQSVPASVIDTALVRSTGSRGTLYVTARYRYLFLEKAYEGAQVGLSQGSDNIGTWHRDMYENLVEAKRTGHLIEVWVDPDNPKRSVIDRDIRWKLVAFSIPFVVLFPLISLGAFWIIYRTLRAPAAQHFDERKLNRNELKIKSDSVYGLRALWIIAIIWCLITFPASFLLVSQRFGQSPVRIVAAAFALIGVWLIWTAALKTLRFRRYGDFSITLNPSQPHLGRSIAVHAKFSRPPTAGLYTLSLLCEQVDDREAKFNCKVIWRQDRTASVSGANLTVSFLPRVNLPASQLAVGLFHRWRILLQFPDGQDERAFDIVVVP
jgi:Protein of unknown function (DUF3592)